MPEQDLFKLDGLILRDNPKSFIFVVNFNVPQTYLLDESVATTKFLHAQSCVQDEFRKEIELDQLYYSVSAAYTLEHKDNGQQRHWRGSFAPRNNQDYFISGHRLYEDSSFLEHVLKSTRPEKVMELLTIAGRDSKWIITELTSIIISFQARCKSRTHLFRPNSRVIPAARLRDVAIRRYVVFTNYLE